MLSHRISFIDDVFKQETQRFSLPLRYICAVRTKLVFVPQVWWAADLTTQVYSCYLIVVNISPSSKNFSTLNSKLYWRGFFYLFFYHFSIAFYHLFRQHSPIYTYFYLIYTNLCILLTYLQLLMNLFLSAFLFNFLSTFPYGFCDASMFFCYLFNCLEHITTIFCIFFCSVSVRTEGTGFLWRDSNFHLEF